MKNAKKKAKVKYPENLPLKQAIVDSGRSIQWYADKMKYNRQTVSQTVNGHYRGKNVVPKLIELLNQ